MNRWIARLTALGALPLKAHREFLLRLRAQWRELGVGVPEPIGRLLRGFWWMKARRGVPARPIFFGHGVPLTVVNIEATATTVTEPTDLPERFAAERDAAIQRMTSLAETLVRRHGCSGVAFCLDAQIAPPVPSTNNPSIAQPTRVVHELLVIRRRSPQRR